MATAEKQKDEAVQETNGNGHNGGGMPTAVKAAVAAAATGAAALAVTKALSGSQGQSKGGESSEGTPSGSNRGSKSSSGSLVTAIASGSWDAAQDALVPLAEEAASAAGTFVATSGPEILRDTIVPNFIDSFNQARAKEDEG